MFKTIFSIALFGLLAVPAVRAQSAQTTEAKIPFDFTVRNTTLEAGTYRLTYNRFSHILRIQSTDLHGPSVAVLADVAGTHSRSDQGGLVFRCAGDDCNLERIWQTTGVRLDVLGSRSKNAMARNSQAAVVTIPAE